jgi:beta-galactosidase
MKQLLQSLRLTSPFILLVCAIIPVLAQDSAPSATPPAAAYGRERLSLDRSWLFHEGDIPFPAILGHQMSYNNAKAGSSWGAAAPGFDDSSWQQVDLPHDWAVGQPFDQTANISQGYRARGMGWYRKYFRLDPADHGKHLEIQLDGIATHCTIWVNGVLAARNWCGYTSVYIDITPFAKFGSDVNVIAVQVDAVAQEGWWYEGAGIYRHTWLVKRNPVHIETDGIYANPVRNADGQWTIPVEAALYSSDQASANVEVESTLIDPSGKEVVSARTEAAVDPLKEFVAKLSLAVATPELWSLDHPTLYSVRTVVKRDGAEIDEATTHCGFRTLRFDPDKGFFLNDQHVELLGTCNHQDMAGVGVAVPDSLWDFRVRRLKEMGSNAYRCAHNPPAAEFLDACDRLGLLVMDENRDFGSSPEYLKQLDWMVRRDRNHPSIILWSVFNEEPSQGTEMGYEMVRRMSAAVKELDTTRPVTAAQSNSALNPVNASQAADVAGFNYRYQDFNRYHELYPTKPIFSSEDTSTVMTRDEYTSNRRLAVLDSYDDQLPGSWGLSHRNAWKEISSRPFVAGTMVWTGFDYRGEPQPLSWPATGSSFGCMDLCGFPKTAYYIHQAQWIQNRPILQLVPHWNWAGSEGKPIKVMALSNAGKVALILNGRPLEEKPVDKYQMATFEVPYEAGKLEAVATTDGREVARFTVETTGAPAGLQLVPDRTSLAGDGCDAQPVTVQVVDAQGRVVPTANQLVKFELSGPGAIIGLNNGDPTCHESEKGGQHSVFHGLAQVMLQSGFAGQGKLTLRATSEGLTPAEIAIDVVSVPARPAVPVASPPQVIRSWSLSPFSAERPDPNQKIGETDMNTWASVQPGRRLPGFDGGRFAIYRAQFTPRAGVQKSGGKINFRDVTGLAQVWIDGQPAGEKTDAGKKTFAVPLPPGEGERTVSVLIETSAPGTPAGLGGTVTIE